MVIRKREVLCIMPREVNPRCVCFRPFQENSRKVHPVMILAFTNFLEKETTSTTNIQDGCFSDLMVTLNIFCDYLDFFPRKIRDQWILVLVIVKKKTRFKVLEPVSECIMREEKLLLMSLFNLHRAPPSFEKVMELSLVVSFFHDTCLVASGSRVKNLNCGTV